MLYMFAQQSSSWAFHIYYALIYNICQDLLPVICNDEIQAKGEMLKMASSIKIITQINLSYVLIRKSFIQSFELVTAFFFLQVL